jgi:hypothetical protein
MVENGRWPARNVLASSGYEMFEKLNPSASRLLLRSEGCFWVHSRLETALQSRAVELPRAGALGGGFCARSDMYHSVQ